MAVSEQEKQVTENFKAFEAKLNDLIDQHEGRWALLRDGSVIEIFDTARDAHIAAWKIFDDERFSVQEISKVPVDLGFYSYAGNTRSS